MAMTKAACAILALCLMQARAARLRESAQAQANPIRKVVNLLKDMAKKVDAEGAAEEELYKKFACYCKTGVSDLEARVTGATNKSPELEADIKASTEKLAQTKASLKTAETEREEAKGAIAKATSIRDKDATTFAATKSELEGYISQIEGAVKALESGMAGSFLQTSVAATLRKVVDKAENVNDDDKETMLSFLAGKYAPKSGEITGILKEMSDSFSKNLSGATEAEATAIKEFDALVVAKKKEIDTLTSSIEAKMNQVGEIGVAITQMKADFEDMNGSLLEDKELLAELKKGCATKDEEYEARVKTRTEELAAITETIKILNDDDALELFKKTLPAPSASLVQVKVTKADLRQRAMSLVQKVLAGSPNGRSRLDFLVLALRGKKVGFDKVIAMIDDMISLLKKEQGDDDKKKEYCASQFDSADDKKKALERKLSDTETAITSSTEQIAALVEEIAQAEAAIQELDKSVATATEIRKEENDEYKSLMQSDAAAKELLLFAKNRLNKFYNPKLYKPPAKEELSAEGAIERDMSFVQLSLKRKALIEPPPATWDAYAKKSEENTGVIAMIDLLVQDMDKEMQEAEVDEKNSQEEYDKTVADAKADRTGLSKSLKEKTAAKADLTADLETLKGTKKSTSVELMATDKFISELHGECDFLVQYYDMRANARAGEIDALGKAKAVLSGADYSM